MGAMVMVVGAAISMTAQQLGNHPPWSPPETVFVPPPSHTYENRLAQQVRAVAKPGTFPRRGKVVLDLHPPIQGKVQVWDGSEVRVVGALGSGRLSTTGHTEIVACGLHQRVRITISPDGGGPDISFGVPVIPEP